MNIINEVSICPPSDIKTVNIEIGYQQVILEKNFGSLVFHDLRIHADPSDGTWVIERSMGFQHENDDTFDQWVEWVRIPGQLEQDFQKLTDMDSQWEKK